MVKQNVNERRAWIRAKHVLSIQFRLIKSKRKSADKSWHLSTTQDMSAGGLSFITDVEYTIDDLLEVHVVMSGMIDIFKGYGKVVRVERKKTASYTVVAVKLQDKLTVRSAKSYKSDKRTSPAAKRKRG